MYCGRLTKNANCGVGVGSWVTYLILIYLPLVAGDADRGLQHVEDALLVQDRGEDDRNVVERRELLFQKLRPLLHRVAVLLDQVPFVDHDDASLAVADDQVVDVQVLRFESLPGVDHQDADV